MYILRLIYYLQVVLVTQSRKKAEAVNEKLSEERAALEDILAQGDTAVRGMEGKMRKVEAEKKALDAKVSSREIDGYANYAEEGDSWQAIILLLLPRQTDTRLVYGITGFCWSLLE